MKGDIWDYMRWTLLIGKYTGLMPIVGLGFPGEIPRFSWKSVCTFIYVINFITLTFVVVIQIYGLLAFNFDLLKLNSLIFFGVHFILCILLFRFAQRFKYFLTDIRSIEKLLPPAWKPRSSVRLTHLIMAAFFLFGIGENVSYTTHAVYITNLCFTLEGDSGWYMKTYFVTSFGWYFNHFPFSYVISFIFQIIKVQAGVMWFYANWIIMVASIYLRNRFEDFNRLVIDNKCMYTKNVKPSWSELQVHYNRLSKIVAILDQNLNATVFVSFTSNLYFVCLDLYIILNKLTQSDLYEAEDCLTQHNNDTLGIIFKVFNTGSLILRTSLFSYLASEVHVVSRRSLMVMHSAPPSAFSGDMQRLMTQIYYSELGVSGLNFFKITRGMLLAMVAKILTYELVVIQF